MDINREEIEDSCQENEEESASNKLSVSSCWETSVGFLTAAHAHPRGLFIHPQSWLGSPPHFYAHKYLFLFVSKVHISVSEIGGKYLN